MNQKECNRLSKQHDRWFKREKEKNLSNRRSEKREEKDGD